MPEIIFDCCCLSNFALTDSLFMPMDMYRSTFITEFIAAEILRGIQSGHKELIRIQDAIKEGHLIELGLRNEKEKSLFKSLSVSLGLGEASSIAVAKARGLIFASDDKAARREAGLLEVRLTGTIGILKKAVKVKYIDLEQGDLILNRMITQGFYASVSSLNDI